MHISVFNPASPLAGSLLSLWNDAMWVCGAVLAVVTVSLAYILIRYTRRERLHHEEDTHEPPQTTGNTRLEIAWTLIPLGLVSLLFILSVMTARAVDRPIRREPDIVVVGHQWWWEVRYPAAITANEIHIPIRRDLLLDIESADVVHDFWPPNLSRKIDAIPGRRNFMWIRADHPGVYPGFCAEFCGPQHAWMRFRVEAADSASYDAWLANQSAPAATPASGDAQAGEDRFKQLTCVNCHNVTGVNRQEQFAPDLTHLASRKMLAGERLENTPKNLRDWLRQPNTIKPNCLMPNFNLDDRDLDLLTAYLGSLK